jgi:hypothetical protein
MIAAVLLLLTAPGGPHQADSWAQIWAELETLRGGKVSAGEASALRGHLTETLRAGAEGPRAELLEAALEALSGRDVRSAAERMAALEPRPFTARELWFLADLMPPGPGRARVVLAAMEVPTALADWQVLLAWNVAVDEARALRFEETALPIQLHLHERFQAGWSADDLALTYKSLGRWQAADEVLARAIERERSQGGRPAALWERRGIQALGSGDETAARDYLGLALAQGSDDAGLLLSRLDLMAGKREGARQGFQALILGAPPPDWAWRGWGMALLPPPHAEPATTNRLPAPE